MNDGPKQDEQVIEYQACGSDAMVRLTLKLIQDIIAVPTRTGNKPALRDCYNFAMLCKARALNPFEGDAFLIGYETKDGPKFSLITAHQAFLKRAELNPDYDGMESGVVIKSAEGKTEDHFGDFLDAGETLLGGWAKVHFKERKISVYRRINLARFKQEYGVWRDNPETMIVKCAEADALRSAFPTKLGGLYLREEMIRIENVKGGPVSTFAEPEKVPSMFGAMIAPPNEPIMSPQGESPTEKPSDPRLVNEGPKPPPPHPAAEKSEDQQTPEEKERKRVLSKVIALKDARRKSWLSVAMELNLDPTVDVNTLDLDMLNECLRLLKATM